MRVSRPARRTPPETIIALIDVVFFLLVFFMLIGRMDATAPFDVAPPTAASGRDMPGGGVTLSIAADGALALDGAAIAGDDLPGAMAKRLAADPGILVRINADAAAPLRRVLPLAAEVEALGAAEVVLVVTPNGGGTP